MQLARMKQFQTLKFMVKCGGFQGLITVNQVIQ